MLTLDVARLLPKSAILVALFLQEQGNQPVGRIAEVTGLSERSVYAALSQLKKTAHDHDLSCLHKEGTVQVSAPVVQEDAPGAQEVADPLQAELVELGIFPQAAARLIERTGREAIQKQIAYHRHRLATGYKFRKSPAAMLYRACENPAAFPPPENMHQTLYKAREGVLPEHQAQSPYLLSKDALDERQERRLGELSTELQLALSRPKSPLNDAVIRSVHRRAQEAGFPIEWLMPSNKRAVG